MKLEDIKHITYIDVTLWLMRAAVVAVVIAGTVGTILKDRYTAGQWFDFVMFGLTMGGIYALVALGYTMVYGILRLINFAHGDIFMTGAFSAYFVANAMGRSGFLDRYPIPALLMAILLGMGVATG